LKEFTVPPSVHDVLRLIEDWRPRLCKTEKDFERSLHKHLEKKLEDVNVIMQYAAGRVKGDIVVDEKILIELKDSLKSTGQLQRLIGQLDIYTSQWKGKVIVIICGDSQRDLMKTLNGKIEALKEQVGFLEEQKIFMVDRAAPREKKGFFDW
jgi:polyhydroxyalkanoate synthesis regulator phasin